MHILGDQQSRTGTDACQQIPLDRLGDQLIQLAALGVDRLVAMFGPDTQYRCQQRHRGHRIQTYRGQFGLEQPQPLAG